MRFTPITLRILTGIAFLSLISTGCISDLANTTAGSCKDLAGGSYVRVTEKDEAISMGTFLCMEKMPFPDYLEHTKSFMAEHPSCAKLPVPGERIYFTTILVPNEYRIGTLIGFCNQYLWVRLQGEHEFSHYYLTGVTRIVRSDGTSIYREELRKLMAENELPCMIQLAVKSSFDTLLIALDNVRHIEVLRDGSYEALDIYAAAAPQKSAGSTL